MQRGARDAGCDGWVALVLMAPEQSRDVCTASRKFLGSFNCSDCELTSQKVFAWPEGGNLTSSPAPELLGTHTGVLKERIWLDCPETDLVWFPELVMLLLQSCRVYFALLLFLFQSCLKNH